MKKIPVQISCMMVLFSALMVIGITGCGKKGPPLPPVVEGNKIAAVTGLEYRVVDNAVILTWKHKIDPDQAAVKPDAFEVFMAKKTFDDCEGCPFTFSLVKVVEVPEMSCSIPVDKGYRYYFRIQAVNEDNVRSGYSKTVQYENK